MVRYVLERRRELDSTTDWDSLIGALSKRRRRYLLYLLAEDATVPIEEIADWILALEAEALDRRGLDAERTDVLIGLLHRDVPVLEEAGVITFDEETNVVDRGRRFSEAIDLLDGAFR